jgi:hypothetical protein
MYCLEAEIADNCNYNRISEDLKKPDFERLLE